MQESDKLRVLLPHWIEHNQEHAAEFQVWAAKAGEASPEILAAAEMLVKANFSLEAALDKLGGPLEYNHTH
jgi:hypothetical protein